MPREVDPKRTRKAMRRLRKLADAKSAETPPEFSGWEDEFIQEVGARLERYGSAFANLTKGRAEEALSVLQAAKLRELEAKAKGKAPRGLSRRKPAERKE
ncbi:MAG: hypothetical protein JNJ73_05125 [Hyphomonadaceae bacterium]|nr:hypothetical protein [Hyphomonadaceae bacterium]